MAVWNSERLLEKAAVLLKFTKAINGTGKSTAASGCCRFLQAFSIKIFKVHSGFDLSFYKSESGKEGKRGSCDRLLGFVFSPHKVNDFINHSYQLPGHFCLNRLFVTTYCQVKGR